MDLTVVEFDSKLLKQAGTGLMAWLRENIGNGAAGKTKTTWVTDQYNWCYYWHSNGRTMTYIIEFRNPDDATLFKLTWL